MEVDDDHRLVSKEEFLQGDWAPLAALASWIREGNGVVLSLADGRVASLEFLSSKAFRFWLPPAVDTPTASPLARTWPTGRVELKVSETETQLLFVSPDLEVRLDKASLSYEVRNSTNLLWKAKAPQWSKRRLRQEFSMASQPLWSGLGSAGTGVDKTGQWVKLWAQTDNAASGPWGVPFLLACGANGAGAAPPFGVLVDNSYQSYVNLVPEKAFLGTLNGGLDFVFWLGRNPADVLSQVASVVGKASRAPAAATTTGLVMGPAAGEFVRRAKLSVGMALANELDSVQGKALEAAHFLPVVTASVADTAFRAQAVGSLYAPPGWDNRYDDGGRNSLLARSNNLFAAWTSALVAKAQKAAFPTTRTWATWQTGFVGSSRWGSPQLLAVAGHDDQVTLDQVVSAGLSGLGSTQVRLDIRPLADPATSPAAWRGLQMALLNPYLLLDAGPDPLAWWLSLGDKEKKLLKTVLDRRSAFKPTMLEVLRQSAQSGAPALRPLFWNYPTDPKARSIRDEFFLGDSLLVAPAVDGNPTRKVYLPGGGVWFQVPAGEEFGGGETYDLPTLTEFPLVFVRAGGFVATREPEVFDDKATYNPLTFHVYPGGVGTGTYSVDDGVSNDDERGLITTVRFAFSSQGNGMEIASEVVDAGPRMRYSDPYLLFRLHKVYNPKAVKIDGKVIPKYGDSFGITDTDRSAAWYENDNTLLIKLFTPDKAQTITLEFAKSP